MRAGDRGEGRLVEGCLERREVGGHEDEHRQLAADVRQLDRPPPVARRVPELVHDAHHRDVDGPAVARRERPGQRAALLERDLPRGLEIDRVHERQARPVVDRPRRRSCGIRCSVWSATQPLMRARAGSGACL